MRVLAILVCLAGCLDEYGDNDPTEPKPVDMPPAPLCRAAGVGWCEGNVARDCQWQEPNVIDEFFGSQPYLAPEPHDCAARGQVCVEDADTAHCAVDSRVASTILTCDQPYASRELEFTRLESITNHPCSSEPLAREEVVIELRAAPGAEVPTVYEVSASSGAPFTILSYNDAPWLQGATCAIEAEDTSTISVEPGGVRYLVIDDARQFSRDTTVLVSAECSVCGDGKAAEACDDGNLEDGDGCSSECTVETGWYCYGDWSIASTCSQN